MVRARVRLWDVRWGSRDSDSIEPEVLISAERPDALERDLTHKYLYEAIHSGPDFVFSGSSLSLDPHQYLRPYSPPNRLTYQSTS